jgi:hypothetical protein
VIKSAALVGLRSYLGWLLARRWVSGPSLALASPFFLSLPLEKYGLSWIQPEVHLAHPVNARAVAVLKRSLDVWFSCAECSSKIFADPFKKHWLGNTL